jgi:hypothetical protein
MGSLARANHRPPTADALAQERKQAGRGSCFDAGWLKRPRSEGPCVVLYLQQVVAVGLGLFAVPCATGALRRRGLQKSSSSNTRAWTKETAAGGCVEAQ